ncbi:ribonuclease H-like domain-containing protein [Tanacetum coccineum]
MAKAKENALSVEIQIISSENVQNYQDIKIKKSLLEDLGVIATEDQEEKTNDEKCLMAKASNEAAENVVKNESHFSLEVVDQDLSPLAMFTKHLMSEQGGGPFAKRSMVAKDGLGGDGFVVDGGRSPSTSSKDGEDGGVENKSSVGSRLIATGEIVVERLLEKLVELLMCSLMMERMVDREEKKHYEERKDTRGRSEEDGQEFKSSSTKGGEYPKKKPLVDLWSNLGGLPSKIFQMTTLVLLVRKESNTRPPVRPKQFSWVFFLRTKDETSAILKDFIRQIENQLNQKVKTIRCDNGTEFKNRDVIEFCGLKGIKREYSNARTPQQNGVAERKNMTLIEAARTMLADSFLPNTFWAEAVSTACYVLNRVLVTKPHNKTPYELLTGKIPIISYIRPFGCHVTILNTIDPLGKLLGKSDEGFFRKGQHAFLNIDYLTDSMNYHPVSSENQANLHAGQQEANQNAGTKEIIDAGDSDKEDESAQDCFVLPIWPSYSLTITPP